MSEISRLRWRCRRGMKELDVLFGRYLDESYEQAPEAEQALFREMLEMDDPDLYAICVRRIEPPEHMQALFDKIRPAA